MNKGNGVLHSSNIIGIENPIKKTHKKKKKMQQRRRSITAGIILLLVITITGTFAFVQMNQAAFNPDLVDVMPGGRIHDVFQGGRNAAGQDMFGPRDNSVFAENFGDVPIGVRVQFSEFVSVQGEGIYNGTTQMDLNNTATWNRVRFNGAMVDGQLVRAGDVATAGTSAYIGNMGIRWQLGHSTGENQMWYMPTFNQVNRPATMLDPFATDSVTSELLHAPEQLNSVFNSPYVAIFSDTSGRAVEPIATGWANSSVNIPADDHEDVGSILDWQDQQLYNAVNNGTAGTNPTLADYLHTLEYFRGQTGRPEHNGTFGFWTPEAETTGTRWYLDPVGNLRYELNYEMTARQTLPAADIRVMSMTHWLSLEPAARRGNFWVHDNYCPEGWFYWVGVGYGMIAPETATSLLLRQTILPALPQLEYVIHTNAQFFTANSVPEIGTASPSTQMTANAALIFGVTPPAPTIPANALILSVTEVARDAVEVQIGELADGFEVVIADNDALEYDRAAGTILRVDAATGYVYLVVAADEQNDVITLVITNENIPGATRTVNITIID